MAMTTTTFSAWVSSDLGAFERTAAFIDSLKANLDRWLESFVPTIEHETIFLTVCCILATFLVFTVLKSLPPRISFCLKISAAAALTVAAANYTGAFVPVLAITNSIDAELDRLFESTELWENVLGVVSLAVLIVFVSAIPPIMIILLFSSAPSPPLRGVDRTPSNRPHKSPPRRSISPGDKRRMIHLETVAVPFVSRAVHRQQGGTCYAHAISTVVRAALERNAVKRGRSPGSHMSHVPSFEHMRNSLISRFGVNGGNVDSVLDWCCGQHGLKYEALTAARDAFRTLKSNRPLVAVFCVSRDDWVRERRCAYTQSSELASHPHSDPHLSHRSRVDRTPNPHRGRACVCVCG